jgi:hypothetical protein
MTRNQSNRRFERLSTDRIDDKVEWPPEVFFGGSYRHHLRATQTSKLHLQMPDTAGRSSNQHTLPQQRSAKA